MTDGKSNDLRMNKCKKKILPHQTVQPLPGILKLGDTRVCIFVGTEEFSGLLFREVRTAGGEKRPLISLLTASIGRRYVFGEANCPNRELKAERLLNSRC
jgi:hypothetical protein